MTIMTLKISKINQEH